MPKKSPKKDIYKYYNLTFRHKELLNKHTLDDIKKYVWEFIGDIAMTDIRCKNVTKPQNWREE